MVGDTRNKSSLLSVKLNNMGVNFLKQRQFDEAVGAFTESLKLMKMLLRKSDTASTTADDDSGSLKFLFTGPGTDDNFPQTQTDDISCSPFEPQHCFIYLNPQAADCVGRRSRLRLTAAVIFNLGLAQHFRALAQDNRRAKVDCLKQVIDLYELSYRIQAEEKVELSSLYTMALLNNLGQSYITMGEEQRSRDCFATLLNHLVVYRERLNARGANGQGNPWGLFFENTASLILKDPVLAPAA
jgi:hypothetical protein